MGRGGGALPFSFLSFFFYWGSGALMGRGFPTSRQKDACVHGGIEPTSF